MNLRNIFSLNLIKSKSQLQWKSVIRQSSSESLKIEPYVDLKSDDDKIALSTPKMANKVVS